MISRDKGKIQGSTNPKGWQGPDSPKEVKAKKSEPKKDKKKK